MKKIIVTAVFFLTSINLFAQVSLDGFSEESNFKARKILEASIKAFGGMDAVKKTRNFSMKINGLSHNLFQGEDPKAGVFEAWKLERTVVYQADKKRLYNDRRVSDVNSPYIWQARQVIRNGEGFDIIVRENWVMRMRDASLGNYTEVFQLLPQNIISDVWERNITLRYLGEATVEGKRQKVVLARLSTGQMLNLFFDENTNLLTKVDSFNTTNVLGDTLNEIFFKGYQSSQATMIPRQRLAFQNKIPRYENNYSEVQLDPQVDDSFFELSSDLIKLDIVETKANLVKMADGVYLIRSLAGGFNLMFVEFKDFVMAIEPVEENVVNGISAESVALIKKKIPNKPIKYVVPTHHHGDHSAGMRAFMAEGATVITSKGNVKYVERLANAKFTFAPDAYAKNPLPLKIQVVENNKMVISDEKQTVEIHQFAPLTHVKEMLLVYLPKNKILYQSDMFNPIDVDAKTIPEDDPWHGINSSNTLDLFDTIKKLELQVEKIAGSHGRLSTMTELTEKVSKLKSTK